jgi:DNA mismatch endonuclease (patch repair protein)
VLPKYKTVIFVNGCFWHLHEGCTRAKLPETNTDFWKEKLESNRRRDKENLAKLRSDGWNVLTVWECELKKNARRERLERLYEEILRNERNKFVFTRIS